MGVPRRKDKRGLTAKQELFCRYYIQRLGVSEDECKVNAYRKAYNCKSVNFDTHRTAANELLKNPSVTLRIEELKARVAEKLTTDTAETISRNVRSRDIDPLDLFNRDAETGKLYPKALDEIPKEIRVLLHPVVIRGRLYWLPDKKYAEKVLIDVVGMEKAKDINLHHESEDGVFYFGDFTEDDYN